MELNLDNTVSSSIERCPEYYRLRHELNLVPHTTATALTFGSAFHLGMKEYYDSKDPIRACATFEVAYAPFAGLDKKRTIEKGHELILAWHDQWGQHEPWTDKAGETQFNLPFAEVCSSCGKESCNCNAGALLKINYSGIIDRLGLFLDEWTIQEFKTSSMPKDFVVRPNNQVTGYVWGAQALLGQPFRNSLVSIAGIYKSSESGYYMAAGAKDSENRSTSKVKQSILHRHLTARTEDDINVWATHVIESARDIYHYRTSYGIEVPWRQVSDNCGYKYGLCQFHPICSAPSGAKPQIIETAFKKEVWIPGQRPINE